MMILGLFIGLFMIGIGFFVKKYPTMISGYNTMSAEKKENVDIEAVASTLKTGMIIIGVLTFLLCSLFSLLKLPILATIAMIAPVLIGTTILLYIIQKYDKNKKSKFKRFSPVILIGFITIVVGIVFVESLRPTQVNISEKKIEFTGQYGVTIQINDISKVELWDQIPRIKMRTNGIEIGNILKGHFMLDKIGKCRLFLNLPNPPFIYIELNNGDKIIFNNENGVYTKEMLDKINNCLGKIAPTLGS